MAAGGLWAVVFTLLTVCASAHAQEQIYNNPVDGKTYLAPGGWKDYAPQGAEPGAMTGPAIRLLTSQDDMARRVTVADLAAYIKNAEDQANPTLSKIPGQAEVLVQFDCAPKKCKVGMASKGDVSQAVLQEVYDRLNSQPALKTTGEVSFQIAFRMH